jgi:hypothetical protein
MEGKPRIPIWILCDFGPAFFIAFSKKLNGIQVNKSYWVVIEFTMMKWPWEISELHWSVSKHFET